MINFNPYLGLASRSFWRTAVSQNVGLIPAEIYILKWKIDKSVRISTAGSCFAQHIGSYLKKKGFFVLDKEPAPEGLPESDWSRFGYGMYSARYGNIYTVRQLLQLCQAVNGEFQCDDFAWEMNNGRYIDAFRPGVEPEGLDSIDEVFFHRSYHLKRFEELLHETEVFVFTLGLTEAWGSRSLGAIYPTAPGVVGGHFNTAQYELCEFSYHEIIGDFLKFRSMISSMNRARDVRFLLTVSPVPLTATATNNHVMQATMHSKSILRAAAGYLSKTYDDIDYFPSYEIVTNPWMAFDNFDQNRRTVRASVVHQIMEYFIAQHISGVSVGKSDEHLVNRHPVQNPARLRDSQDHLTDVACEDALLEAFSPKRST